MRIQRSFGFPGFPTGLLLIIVSLQVVSSLSHIVINEVEVNPAGEDIREFVELYNPTEDEVDIAGWTLVVMHVYADDKSLEYTTRRFTGEPGKPWILNPDRYAGQGGGLALADGSPGDLTKGCQVILLDASGKEIDRTPVLSDPDDDERSWQRYPNGQDTDKDTDWSFRPSTKMASNGPEPPGKPQGLLMSKITCNVSSASINEGQKIRVFGSVNPLRSDVQVIINYTWVPNMGPPFSVLRYVTTNYTGFYSDSWGPNATGPWNVSASWAGDESYRGATSPTVPFGVATSSYDWALWVILGMLFGVFSLLLGMGKLAGVYRNVKIGGIRI